MDAHHAASLPAGEDYIVLHDTASGAVVVDVTDCRDPFVRERLAKLGSPVLMCFGAHPGNACSLEAGHSSGVVVHVADGDARHEVFVESLRAAFVKDALSIRVTRQEAPRAASLTAAPQAGGLS